MIEGLYAVPPRRFLVVSHLVRYLGVSALLCALLPQASAAQDRRHPRWEIPGFDFRKDGVWRVRARAVRATRARLRAAGRFGELNASAAVAGGAAPLRQAGAEASATVVSGTLKVPAILFRYKDSPAPTFVAANYDDVLFGATPTGAAAGRPYTYRSFYKEMSNGLFDIQGKTYGYTTLDSNEVYYTGGTSATCQAANPYGSTNCNGLFSSAAISRMRSGLMEALTKLDATIDFSQYVDSTTGFVPLVLFMHEAIGGECGPSNAPQNHLWAPRFPLSATAFYVRVQGSNPRGEYFLLENRQRQQSDSAVIRYHCHRAGDPPGCTGGLLIWHVDSAQMATPGNSVNTGSIHGLELMQADAFGNLDAAAAGNACPATSMVDGCSNRGDAGDLYPGTLVNTALVYRTNPASLKNFDGSFAGVAIDSIRQLVTDHTMAFRLRFGALTVARASDTGAVIQFDASNFNVFRDLLEAGSSHTIGFSDNQVAPNGRTRWHFVSWSDGFAMSHTITGSLSGTTYTATVRRDFKLIATSSGTGSITPDTMVNLAGDFIPENRPVKLTPIPSGNQFCGWTGDSTTTDSVITVPMQRPYTLTASFGTGATITSGGARPAGIMGATYADTLKINGGGGATVWTITTGALPQGLTLSTAGVVSGFPRQTGDFSYTAQVTSCSVASRAFTLSVTAPTLATGDVVAQLLGPTAPLNADQVRYLDFLGNNNGNVDVGDFLAWVKATGAPPSAAALQAVQRKGGRQ